MPVKTAEDGNGAALTKATTLLRLQFSHLTEAVQEFASKAARIPTPPVAPPPPPPPPPATVGTTVMCAGYFCLPLAGTASGLLSPCPVPYWPLITL